MSHTTTTEKTGPCACADCRRLCDGRPGIFAPTEVEPAAAELGLTLEEFFERYLTIDFQYFMRQAYPYSGPSTVGRRCTTKEGCTKGTCALLGPSGCRLSFERRPEECRRAYGCAGWDNYDGSLLHNEVSRKWRDDPIGAALLARLAKYNTKEIA
jgi:hypothetical protein